jgi:hypothetical protein
MRIVKREGYTAIILDIEEVKKNCRPGAGPDTCIWLVCGAEGFECLYYKKDVESLTGDTLIERWRRGQTVAKRDGCDEIKKLLLQVTSPMV